MLEIKRRHISSLIIKKINGRINHLENMELEEWAGLSTVNRSLLDELLDRDLLMTQLLTYKKPDLPAAWEKLVVKIPALQPVTGPGHAVINLKTVKNRTGRHWWAIAALLVILILAGTVKYFYFQPNKVPSGMSEEQVTRKEGEHSGGSISTSHDLQPAVYKLRIALPSRDTMDVAEVPENGMFIHDNMKIHPQGEGMIVYGQNGLAKNKPFDCWVGTPKGGWFFVMLPDGTKVRLNAASSLSFKSSFGRKERKVILHGEAYFEVARNTTAPFTVQVKRAQDIVRITAHGTSFNVTAYEDDDLIKTTMVAGAVRVEGPAHSSPVELHAGQQYVQYADGKDLLQDGIDTAAAIAWKNDMFIFKGESLPEVMRQISRWYDASVVYKEIPDVRIATKGSRKRPLSSLLERIEATGEVHFKIEDHRIIVSR